MAEPPHGESVAPSTNSKSDDSNKVKQDDRSASPPPPPKNSVTTEPVRNGSKAKSCKGCLYYSSALRADSRNPVCVGITRSLPGAPVHIVGQSEIEASREGRNLADFRYTCVGYSIYNNQKDQSSDGRKSQTELPLCAGLEILVDRVSSQTANSTSAPAPGPAHIHNKEDSNGLPQRHSPKPSNSSGEEFLPRFTRNAKLVANGVAKNARRVGNQIKQFFDDIVYPYRRPPK